MDMAIIAQKQFNACNKTLYLVIRHTILNKISIILNKISIILNKINKIEEMGQNFKEK